MFFVVDLTERPWFGPFAASLIFGPAIGQNFPWSIVRDHAASNLGNMSHNQNPGR